MQKYILNGEAALIHSDDWGTPWATWYPETMFDRELIGHYLRWLGTDCDTEQEHEAEYAARLYLEHAHPEVAFRGFAGLKLTWIKQGQEFIIREYDGIETVLLKDKVKWLMA
jgi:hypothetical protein